MRAGKHFVEVGSHANYQDLQSRRYVSLNTLVILLLLEVASFGLFKLRSTLDGQEDRTSRDPRESSSYYVSQSWAPVYWREFASSRRTLYHAYTVWRRAPFNGETINVDERGVRRDSRSRLPT